MNKKLQEIIKKFPRKITGFRWADPKQISANAKNWRLHPTLQQDAVLGALEEVGWVDALKVNKDGVLVDGHLRLKIALEHGETEVPVLDLDLTSDEVDYVLATFDPLTELAEIDTEQFKRLYDSSALKSVASNAVRDLLDTIAAGAGIIVIPPMTNGDSFDNENADTPPSTGATKEFPQYSAADVKAKARFTCPSCGYVSDGK